MPTPRPIVAALDEQTRDRDLILMHLGPDLGVDSKTVSKWRNGNSTPYFPHAVAWANHLGLHIAAVDGKGRTLAVDHEIPARLRTWRKAAGLTSEDVGRRRHMVAAAVCRFELRPRFRLTTLEAHLAALGIRLVLIPAEQEVAA